MTDPIAVAARFLADPSHLEWIRHRPPDQVGEFLEDVESCWRDVVAIARGPRDKTYLGPCGAPQIAIPPEVAEEQGIHPANAALGLAPCDGDMRAYPGAVTGRCDRCGATVPVAERREWLEGLVRERNFRAAHIADAYGISADTIRSWASGHNGKRPVRLFPKGYDPKDGAPLYNVADVLELDRQAKERKAERAARKAQRTGDAA